MVGRRERREREEKSMVWYGTVRAVPEVLVVGIIPFLANILKKANSA